MGKLLPPVDVTSMSQLNDLDARIKQGPFTLVLVYADWCGHCQRFKPMMEQLESCPGRSVQVARIRDDMYPKSRLSSVPTEGYPSLLLVQQNGTPVNFQTSDGTSTTVIPDHTDMLKMTTLVRNAGTPAGRQLIETAPNANAIQTMSAPSIENLSHPSIQTQSTPGTTPSPTGIIADRLSPTNVARLNQSLINTQDSLLKEATKPIGAQQGGSRGGGGLFETLMMTSQRLAPAAALLLASSAVNRPSRKRSRRTRRRGLKRKN